MSVVDQIKADGLVAIYAAQQDVNEARAAEEQLEIALAHARALTREAEGKLATARIGVASFADMPTPDLRERIADLAREHAQRDWRHRTSADVEETWRPFRRALGELATRALGQAAEPPTVYPGVRGTLVTMGDDAALMHADRDESDESVDRRAAELVITLSREGVQKLGALGLLRQTVYIGPVPETR